MVIELNLWAVALAAALIFLVGYILGKLLRTNPHCSGSLIVDEKGETERWTIMFDDPLEDVKKLDSVYLKVDLRA